jgi:hypothetical protein
MSLSSEALKILTEYEKKGEYQKARSIYLAPLPPNEWWNIISKCAKSKRPFWDAAKELAIALLSDIRIPAWPPAMYEEAEELPPVSIIEAAVIIDRFLKLETIGLFAGTLVYKLHWDVLCAHYCPLRERYQILNQLIRQKMLNGPSIGVDLKRNNTEPGWPLIITDEMITYIRKSRLKWRLPTFHRIEYFLSNLLETYPSIVKIIIWLIIGGGVVKVLEFVIKIFFQSLKRI